MRRLTPWLNLHSGRTRQERVRALQAALQERPRPPATNPEPPRCTGACDTCPERATCWLFDGAGKKDDDNEED